MSANTLILDPATQTKIYKYNAFISYKHNSDSEIAKVLQSSLQRIGNHRYKAPVVRIYRDKTDLELTDEAWAKIKQGLENSKYLILLASPQGAQSPWVQKEVQYWVKNRSIKTLLIILTDGEIAWGDSDFDWEITNALPKEVLKEQYKGVPLYMDLRGARTAKRFFLRRTQLKEAAVELSARVQDREKASVLSDEVRVQKKMLQGAIFFAAVFLLVAIYAFQQQRFAKQQTLEAQKQRDKALAAQTKEDIARKAEANAAEEARQQRDEAQKQRDKAVAAQTKEEIARKAEANAAKEARQQRDEAERQRAEAVKQTEIAQKNEREARQSQYVANMSLARRAYDESKDSQAQELLEELIPSPEFIGKKEDVRGFPWYYTWQKHHQEFATYSLKNKFSFPAAFSTASKMLATSGNNNTIRILEVSTGKELAVFKGHEKDITCVAFSQDGKFLASGGIDGTIKLWKIGKDKEMYTLQEKADVTSIAISKYNKLLAIGNSNGFITLWEVATGNKLRSFQGHERTFPLFAPSPVNSLAFSPDEMTLASGGVYNTVNIWEVATGDKLSSNSYVSTFYGPGYGPGPTIVECITFTTDGKILAWASGGGIWLRETDTNRVRSFKAHDDIIFSLAFSPDFEGKTLASGTGGGKIKLWEVTTNKEITSLTGLAAITSLAFGTEGTTLVSENQNGKISLWEVPANQKQLFNGTAGILALAFSKDSKKLAWGAADGTIAMWEVSTSTPQIMGAINKNPINSLIFRQDEKLLYQQGPTFYLREALTDKPLNPINETILSCPFGCNFLVDDGKAFLVVQPDRETKWNKIKILETSTSKELAIFKGHEKDITCVALSQDGKLLASGGMDSTIKLWERGKDKESHTLKAEYPIVSMAFSKDNQLLATCNLAGLITLWEVATGNKLRTLKGHTSVARSIAFSPDGRTLASGGADSTIRLWDIARGKELIVLKDHRDEVTSVVFSPDGRMLASGSNDKTIRLWRASTDDEVARQQGK
jgi:WD40 repeat protein